MSRTNQSITFIADNVRFLTSDQAGLFWNGLEFNNKATTFSEPTFHTRSEHDGKDLYTGANDFFTPDANDPQKHTSVDKQVNGG